MARVVVVGGGFAGLSAAARLAKLHHRVTLLEATETLGGRLRGIELGGTMWPLDPEPVSLPGVLRDLFRKSGRPIERTLDLLPAPGRRHIFADGTVLDLPMGTRSAQHDAMLAAFGEDRWSPWVDRWTATWDALRRNLLDTVPTTARALDRAATRALSPRRTARRAARPLTDERLRAIVLDRLTLNGHDPRTSPGFLCVEDYVERNFGRWSIAGGRPALADALTTRLAERRVDVRLSERAYDVTRGDSPAVLTGSGVFEADLVLWCAPTWPESWGTRPGMPLVPAARTCVAVDDRAPVLADETVVHDHGAIRVFTAGPGRWVIEHRCGEDPLDALARHGMDLRAHVLGRHDLSPSDLARLGPAGWAWIGFGSFFRRPGVNPDGRIYVAGATAYAGPGLETIGMSTAAIANHISR